MQGDAFQRHHLPPSRLTSNASPAGNQISAFTSPNRSEWPASETPTELKVNTKETSKKAPGSKETHESLYRVIFEQGFRGPGSQPSSGARVRYAKKILGGGYDQSSAHLSSAIRNEQKILDLITADKEARDQSGTESAN